MGSSPSGSTSMNLSWMYRLLLKPVSSSPTKFFKVACLELRARGDHRVVDLIDLIFDIGLRGSCRRPRIGASLPARTSTSQKTWSRLKAKVMQRMRCAEPIKSAYQCSVSNGFLVVTRAEQGEHPIGRRRGVRCGRRFHCQVRLHKRRPRNVRLREPLPVVQVSLGNALCPRWRGRHWSGRKCRPPRCWLNPSTRRPARPCGSAR